LLTNNAYRLGGEWRSINQSINQNQAAILKVWRHVRNLAPPIDGHLLE